MKKEKQPKKKREPEPFFKAAVYVYLSTHQQLAGFAPRFSDNPAAQRALRLVMKSLRERSEQKGIVWTETVATEKLHRFIEYANQNGFQQDLSIFNLNVNKDFIFQKIQNK